MPAPRNPAQTHSSISKIPERTLHSVCRAPLRPHIVYNELHEDAKRLPHVADDRKHRDLDEQIAKTSLSYTKKKRKREKKTKKTTRPTYAKGYLKRPVLGSLPLRLTRRPSRRELEHDARGQKMEKNGSWDDARKGKKSDPAYLSGGRTKTQTGTRRNRTKEPATREQKKKTGTASQDGEETGHQDRFTFRFGSAGSVFGALSLLLGSGVGACEHIHFVSLCSILGSEPEGSATEPSAF